MATVVVVNVKDRHPKAEYIGRPSPLGNPFPMKGEGTRNQVIEQYKAWLKKKIADKDPAVIQELYRLYNKYKAEGELYLACYCAPKACHGDVLKAAIDAKAGK